MKRLPNSLKARIIGLMTLLQLTVVVIVAFTLVVLNTQKADGVTINMAGRQRMLSQKFSKEFLDSLARSGESGDGAAAGYMKTKELFEVTLDALRNGGKTYSDLGMTQPIALPATGDAGILAKLGEVDGLWKKLVGVVEAVKAVDRGSDLYAAKMDEFRSLNIQVLKNMNAAVGMYQVVSEGKVARLKMVQIVAVLVSLVVFGFSIWMITVTVVRPMTMMIRDLREQADSVDNSSGEISASSMALADGVSNQAASVEETSAAMEEMSATSKENAVRADRASSLVTQATSHADNGKKAMEQLDSAMAAIQTSTEEVSKVLRAIEDIAFQTNLLALNAAIEAEGAGEHGKRFAVVAEEVRKLAERSGEAAKETATRIEDAVRAVADGVKYSEASMKSLNEIHGGVGEVETLVQSIDASSQEQALGVNQINKAIVQIDGITQSNAAAAEESAASASEMSAQSNAMRRTIGELDRLIFGSRSGVVDGGGGVGGGGGGVTLTAGAGGRTFSAQGVSPMNHGVKLSKAEEAIPFGEEVDSGFEGSDAVDEFCEF